MIGASFIGIRMFLLRDGPLDFCSEFLMIGASFISIRMFLLRDGPFDFCGEES